MAARRPLVQMIENRNTPAIFVVTGVCAISIALIAGPSFSPPEFSWLRHTVSEQAGQQIVGGWIARSGFVAYGLTTLAAGILDWRLRPPVRVPLAIFGAALVGTAIWSNASIIPGVISDLHEDWLHSVAAGIVGSAFAFACAMRIFAPGGSTRDVLAWVGLAMSLAIPLAMNESPAYRGLLQRMMFVMSFVFVIREFAVLDRRAGTTP